MAALRHRWSSTITRRKAFSAASRRFFVVPCAWLTIAISGLASLVSDARAILS